MTRRKRDRVSEVDLDLGLDLLGQSLELLHVGAGGRPVDAKTLGLIGLGDLGRLVNRCRVLKGRNCIPCGSGPRILLVILIPKIPWHGSTYVVNLLVGNGAVVLEDVVVRRACGVDKLLERRLDEKDE